jgi:hypothetical protein
MYDIQQITSFAKQSQTLKFPDGTTIAIELEYKPLQYGWFITNLTYGDFALSNIRIVISPNFLYQWKNKIPYGIGCSSTDGFEPVNQEDFNSGRCRLYVLEAADVAALQEYISGN